MKPSTQAHKILIVEDEGLIARDLANRLEALGHTVIATVGTAAEALEAAAGAELVLMDIRLDGPADGIDAAARIHEKFHLPVVFLTALVDGSTLERAKHADPYGYIVKPVASATLQTTIVMAVYKHRVQRQLEESEAWQRAVLHAAADALITTDPQGTIRTMNPAAERLLGRTTGKLTDLIPNDPAAMAILKDGPVKILTRLRERELEGFATPVKAGSRAIGAVITLHDVSAQRREQLRIRQMAKAETAAELASAMAGDYASLIAAIRNQAEHLLRQFADFSPVRQALEEIQQAAATADQITRGLAGLGAEEPGHPEIVSLHATLRRMTRLIQSVAGDRVTVTIRPGASMGRIHADPTKVEETLMRLVLHAAKAMSDGGQLVIETGDAGDDVSLSLTHDGTPSHSAAGDISMARYLATEDGRRLETFFPRWIEAAAGAETPPTILLIEPRDHIRGRLHNFFEANGFNLLEASDAEQARMLLELQTVDLVICEEDTVAMFAGSVRVLPVTPPYSQQSLLDRVRAAVPPVNQGDPLTFSASHP